MTRRRRDAALHPPGPLDPDAVRLRQLGYEQQLRRELPLFDNVAVGFATISPVVGLYAVVLVGTLVAGPAWVWVLPVALAGQCLLLAVYAELASEFPISHGAYQWTKRLVGPLYGWLNGWVALCAYMAANTTVAYLAAPWVLSLVDASATPGRVVGVAVGLVALSAAVNARGIRVLSRLVRAGVAAEVVASVVVGLALLLLFREHGLSILTETLGAEALSGGSRTAAFLAALAVAGWVFIGFDACVLASEETRDAGRRVPRAVWIALLSVAAVVMLNAIAVALAHPDPGAVVEGNDVDPVTTAVVSGFGSWSSKPFVAVVVAAFMACLFASHGVTARGLFSVARDGALPASRVLAWVDARGAPVGAVAVSALVTAAGLLLGLESTAIGSLIAFGTAGYYVSFLLIALAALLARARGRWLPAGAVRLGRWGIAANVLAVGWLAFEVVNIAWPRASLAPPSAPWYQVWAAPLALATIAVAGGAYLLVRQPTRP